MNNRKIPLSIAAIGALSTVLANAAPASARACAAAFADNLTSQGLGTPKFRVDYSGAYATASQSAFYPSEGRFDLQVLDAKSGAPRAPATCSVDAHGRATLVTDTALVGKL